MGFINGGTASTTTSPPPLPATPSAFETSLEWRGRGNCQDRAWDPGRWCRHCTAGALSSLGLYSWLLAHSATVPGALPRCPQIPPLPTPPSASGVSLLLPPLTLPGATEPPRFLDPHPDLAQSSFCTAASTWPAGIHTCGCVVRLCPSHAYSIFPDDLR